jgi:hypothetical protein
MRWFRVGKTNSSLYNVGKAVQAFSEPKKTPKSSRKPRFDITDGVLNCTPTVFIDQIMPITNLGREGKIQKVHMHDPHSGLEATLVFTPTMDASLPSYNRQQLERMGLGDVLNKSPVIQLVMKKGPIGYIVKEDKPGSDAHLLSQNVLYPRLEPYELKVSEVTAMWGKNDPEGSRIKTICPSPNSAVMLTYCVFPLPGSGILPQRLPLPVIMPCVPRKNSKSCFAKMIIGAARRMVLRGLFMKESLSSLPSSLFSQIHQRGWVSSLTPIMCVSLRQKGRAEFQGITMVAIPRAGPNIRSGFIALGFHVHRPLIGLF